MAFDENRPKFLTIAEYSRLFETARERSARHAFTVFLLGHTGLTTREAAHFRPDWFEEDNRRVTVPQIQGDFSPQSQYRARDIPLQTPASKSLQNYLEKLPSNVFDVRRENIYKRIRLAAWNSQLKPHAPHSLRKTFRLRLHAIDVPRKYLEQMMGDKPTWVNPPSISRVDLDGFQLLYPDWNYQESFLAQ